MSAKIWAASASHSASHRDIRGELVQFAFDGETIRSFSSVAQDKALYGVQQSTPRE